VNTFLKFGELLSEPVNQMISHVMTKFGLGSILTGGGLAVAQHTQVIEQGGGITSWLTILAIVGSILFITQKIVETVCTIVLTRHKMKGK